MEIYTSTLTSRFPSINHQHVVWQNYSYFWSWKWLLALKCITWEWTVTWFDVISCVIVGVDGHVISFDLICHLGNGRSCDQLYSNVSLWGRMVMCFTCNFYMFALIGLKMKAIVQLFSARFEVDSSAVHNRAIIRLEQEIFSHELSNTGTLFVYHTTRFWSQIKSARWGKELSAIFSINN